MSFECILFLHHHKKIVSQTIVSRGPSVYPFHLWPILAFIHTSRTVSWPIQHSFSNATSVPASNIEAEGADKSLSQTSLKTEELYEIVLANDKKMTIC